MKLKVGNAYIAKRKDEADLYWTLRIIDEFFQDGNTVFLALKQYECRMLFRAVWFDKNGKEIQYDCGKDYRYDDDEGLVLVSPSKAKKTKKVNH